MVRSRPDNLKQTSDFVVELRKPRPSSPRGFGPGCRFSYHFTASGVQLDACLVMASSSRTAAPAMTPTVMPMRYSSLTGATGALQTKNMSSGFAREEKQTWWSRRTNNYTQEVLEEQRKNKRRRLLGEEPPEVEEDKRDEETNGHQDGVNGDDPAADETMDDESKERSASAKEPGFKVGIGAP